MYRERDIYIVLVQPRQDGRRGRPREHRGGLPCGVSSQKPDGTGCAQQRELAERTAGFYFNVIIQAPTTSPTAAPTTASGTGATCTAGRPSFSGFVPDSGSKNLGLRGLDPSSRFFQGDNFPWTKGRNFSTWVLTCVGLLLPETAAQLLRLAPDARSPSHKKLGMIPYSIHCRTWHLFV